METVVYNELWQSYWDAESLARYYEAVYKKLQRWNLVGTFILGVSGTGAAITLIAGLPKEFQAVIGGLLAIVSVGMFVSALSTKAAVAHSISVQCSGLALEFKTLFYEYRSNDFESDYAMKEWSKLVERLMNVTSKAGAIGLTTDDKLITKSYETASKVIRLSHATT